jgi:hypothetical protein
VLFRISGWHSAATYIVRRCRKPASIPEPVLVENPFLAEGLRSIELYVQETVCWVASIQRHNIIRAIYENCSRLLTPRRSSQSCPLAHPLHSPKGRRNHTSHLDSRRIATIDLAESHPQTEQPAGRPAFCPFPHRGHREGSSGTSTTSSTCFDTGRRQRRPYFWPLFRPGFWGWALGCLSGKGAACRLLARRPYFHHPLQPFIVGFQLLILTPELRYFFGNIFLCNTPD